MRIYPNFGKHAMRSLTIITMIVIRILRIIQDILMILSTIILAIPCIFNQRRFTKFRDYLNPMAYGTFKNKLENETGDK